LGEALAQLAGLVGLHGAGARVGGRLAHVDLRFDHAVRPPTEVVLFASLLRGLGPLMQFEVRAEAEGRVAARGTLTLAVTSGDQGGEDVR
jgi:acyl-coenzyme A thioesterase PaaI-like protein